MRLFLFFTLLFFTFSSIRAQDKIYRKNGQIVKAKVLEIGTGDVKYKLADSTDSPIYVLEKDRIRKIVYQNGRTEHFIPDLKDPEQYTGQLRKAIKVDFLGPLLGYSQISYEKNLGVGKSYEVMLSIISAGKNQILNFWDYTLREKKKNQFGLAASVGYKFNKLPDFLFGRTRFTHLMQGAYAKPVAYLGHYGENRIVYKANNQYVVERQKVAFGALQVELGKQWVFGDKFLIDGYWGLGYGFDNKKNGDGYYDNTAAYNYINARLGRSPGFSTTFGIKLGLLIK